VGHKGAISAGGGPKVVIREGITQRSVHSTILESIDYTFRACPQASMFSTIP